MKKDNVNVKEVDNRYHKKETRKKRKQNNSKATSSIVLLSFNKKKKEEENSNNAHGSSYSSSSRQRPDTELKKKGSIPLRIASKFIQSWNGPTYRSRKNYFMTMIC